MHALLCVLKDQGSRLAAMAVLRCLPFPSPASLAVCGKWTGDASMIGMGLLGFQKRAAGRTPVAIGTASPHAGPGPGPGGCGSAAAGLARFSSHRMSCRVILFPAQLCPVAPHALASWHPVGFRDDNKKKKNRTCAACQPNGSDNATSLRRAVRGKKNQPDIAGYFSTLVPAEIWWRTRWTTTGRLPGAVVRKTAASIGQGGVGVGLLVLDGRLHGMGMCRLTIPSSRQSPRATARLSPPGARAPPMCAQHVPCLPCSPARPHHHSSTPQRRGQ
jgi:hypothetical protein